MDRNRHLTLPSWCLVNRTALLALFAVASLLGCGSSNTASTGSSSNKGTGGKGTAGSSSSSSKGTGGKGAAGNAASPGGKSGAGSGGTNGGNGDAGADSGTGGSGNASSGPGSGGKGGTGGNGSGGTGDNGSGGTGGGGGKWEWVRGAGGWNFSDRGASVAVSADGSAYVAGVFEGTATFGSTTLTSAGSSDIFLTKYDSNGSVLWAESAGGTDLDVADSIAVLADGSAYISGYFDKSATFGSTTVTSAGGSDIFLAKYDSNGNVLWAKSAGGTGSDIGASAALADGSSYVAGVFEGTATFGSTTLTSAGGLDSFLTKYDSSGNVLWAKNAGGTGSDAANSVALLADGSAYVTGIFSGSAKFGSTTLTSAGASSDFFLAKYDGNGSVLWAKSAGGGSDIQGLSVALLADGSAYAAGYFDKSATFGSTTLTGVSDFFLAKYDSEGNVLWATSASGAGSTAGSVAVLADGSAYVTGFFKGSATLGSAILTSAGSSDIFLAKYDSEGNVLWAESAGGTGSDGARSVAVLADGSAYVTGFFDTSATFGSKSISPRGTEDIFLAKWH